MVLETALFHVPPENRPAFEAALAAACALFANVPGHVRHEHRRGIESPDTHLLLVWWETLEAHTVAFRQSPVFAEWRALLRPHYAGSAEILHYAALHQPVLTD